MGGRLDPDGPPGVGAGNGVQVAHRYCPFAAHGQFTLLAAHARARHSRCGNQPLESRMRENRTYGSEGGEGVTSSRPLSGFWQEIDRIGFIFGRALKTTGYEMRRVLLYGVHARRASPSGGWRSHKESCTHLGRDVCCGSDADPKSVKPKVRRQPSWAASGGIGQWLKWD